MKKISKETLVVIVIIILGCLFRIVGITNYPNALNADEASSGYEAFAISNYGIDRNGHKLPVFLESWGSGQNALLSYLAIPFVRIFGLSIFSIRFPMVIVGSISLVVFYFLLKRLFNKKTAMIGLLFLAICPWHIMKSRWGLESNLFPDLILYFTFFLVKGLQDKNKLSYYCSFAIAGISSYAYGISYMFLPIFLIPLLFILKIKNEISIKEFFISLLIVILISLPIILFVIINTFGFPTLTILCFTIPHLNANRYKIITSIFSNNFFNVSISNIKETIKILVFQTDGLNWNALKHFGTIYLFSSIFTLIGLFTPLVNKLIAKKENLKIKIVTKKDERSYNWIFALWLLSSFVIAIVCEPNINRLNIIMFPIIYYTVLGIYYFVDYKKIYGILITIIYTIYFGLFIGSYLREDWNSYSTFEGGLAEVFEYVNSLELTNTSIIISNSIKEPYIYTLFYTRYNPYDFSNTVAYRKGTENAEFRIVESFSCYYFGLDKEDDISNNILYILKKNEVSEPNLDEFEVKEINNYWIIRAKNPQLDY